MTTKEQFDETVFDKLELSENTKKNLKSQMRVVFNLKKAAKLTNYSVMIKKIQKQTDKIGSQSQLVNALIKYLTLTGRGEDSSIAKYKKFRENTQKKIEANVSSSTIPANKLVNYTGGITTFKKDIKEKKYETTSPEFILALYVLVPPRRLDYVDMIYTETEPKDEKTNYLFKDGSKYFFIFNKFKTKKQFGKQQFEITNEMLKKIIKKKKFSEGKPLFTVSKRTLQRQLDSITEKYFGQVLGVQQLRKYHTTASFPEFKKDIEKFDNDAKQMAHSKSTKIKYYLKNVSK